ncbi:MAG: DUF2786 domain-containing protein [Marmoricola sp.]
MTAPDAMSTTLAKVRKLLAQAEDPACTAAEAEAFTAKATQLVAAHGIDEALLAAADPDRDRVGDRVVDLDAPYAREKGALGAEVARGLRCEVVLRQERRYDDRRRVVTAFSIHVFGHEADLRAFEVLFTSLLLQGTRDVNRALVPSCDTPAAYRRTWWLGFAGAVGSRLLAAERAAAAAAEERFAAQGTSAALVLADRAEDALRARRDAYPRARAGATRRLTGTGGAHGWAAGRRADLGGTGLAQGSRGEIAG